MEHDQKPGTERQDNPNQTDRNSWTRCAKISSLMNMKWKQQDLNKGRSSSSRDDAFHEPTAEIQRIWDGKESHFHVCNRDFLRFQSRFPSHVSHLTGESWLQTLSQMLAIHWIVWVLGGAWVEQTHLKGTWWLSCAWLNPQLFFGYVRLFWCQPTSSEALRCVHLSV